MQVDEKRFEELHFEELNDLVENKKFSVLRQEIQKYPVQDIADFIDELDEKQALIVFRLLPKEIAADAFAYLSVEKQTEIINLVNEEELSRILDDLYFDDKIDFIEEMPAYLVKRILKNTNEMERRLINQFLKYPDSSAGSLMTIEYVDLKKELLVRDALDYVRRTAPDKETIYTCYVIDKARHLEGTLSLKDLVLASEDKKIADIMQKDVLFAYTHDDQEDVANLFKKYDLLALPVVDNEQRLVGIITIDDIIDVIEEEATEDILKMAAVRPTEEEYIQAGTFKLARKRIIWLMVLMISATFTGYIIRGFSATLESVVILAAYIPMLMDTGGNAGAQASTLVIRSIVLGEVTFKDTFKVIWKELRVSILVGATLALFNFFRILILDSVGIDVALTVAITLMLTVILAKLLGGMLPIIAKKLKLDPAIMASPLITTIVDAFSLIIYFYLATLIINIPNLAG